VDPNHRIPILIRIASWYLILNGTLALVGMILALFVKKFQFDPDCIAFIFGIALLRLRNGWRTFLLLTIPLSIAWQIYLTVKLDSLGWPKGWVFMSVFPYSVSRGSGLALCVFNMILPVVLWVILMLPSSRSAFRSKILRA
jgi:hypothetical protein